MATLHHALRRFEVDAFELALGRWPKDRLGEEEGTIAIHGKALPGVARPGTARGQAGGGLCWRKWLEAETKGVKWDQKESELGMAAGLPAQLELEARVATGDALHCQHELSLRVLQQGGDH